MGGQDSDLYFDECVCQGLHQLKTSSFFYIVLLKKPVEFDFFTIEMNVCFP